MRTPSLAPKLIAVVLATIVAIELTGWMVLPSWSISASTLSPAKPQQIWDWYVDTRHWPDWDHLVDTVESNGPFTSGTTGVSRAGSLRMRSELADVHAPSAYTEILHVPLARLTATHVLTPTAEGTRIEHAMTVRGPAAWILFVVQRQALQDGMNDALHRLATHAADGLPTQRLP